MTQDNARPGLERLVRRYARGFQIPENLEHYAPEDFANAQRRFVQHCLQHGCRAPSKDETHGPA